MTPVAIVSASRLRIGAWDDRGLWLVDLDSPRRLRLDLAGTIVETDESLPTAVSIPTLAPYPPGSPFAAKVPDHDDASAPALPAGTPHGWTVRWGDRWAVLAFFDKLFVGRGDQREVVVHLADSSDQIRAYPPGVVIHLFGSDHAFPWDAFDRGEIYATPHRIELAAAQRRCVRVLQAGATILRVEIVDPEPHWRPTTSVPSHGNPLGLAVGDLAIAIGNEVERQFAITRVLRSEPAASTTTVTRGEPVRVATGKARCPPWIPGLIRAGLIDAPEDVPEHLWLETPLQALVAMYEPRGALDRGFAWYRVKIQNSTKSPIADFAQMARAPKGALSSIRIRSYEDLDGFREILDKVNARLAAHGVPRRIYELVTEGPWYAFVACTPEELEVIEDAGLTPERVRRT
jgi:hypothetical protein